MPRALIPSMSNLTREARIVRFCNTLGCIAYTQSIKNPGMVWASLSAPTWEAGIELGRTMADALAARGFGGVTVGNPTQSGGAYLTVEFSAMIA